MKDTDLSIFTNKDNVKLVDRFNVLLKNSSHFDVLIGYFRMTGFYLLRNSLEEVSEIRILIGIGSDFKNPHNVDIFDFSKQKSFESIKSNVINEFQQSEDNLDVENGVVTFLKWVNKGKIKIRMTYENNVHAKVYIIRKNQDVLPGQYGHLITGSSNFSYSGLEKNIEFNVELKNQADVKHALEFFEELWLESVDISEEIENVTKNDTWMNDSISPYEMYLKTLYEYFKEELDEVYINDFVPDGFKNFSYQRHAVIQAKKIIERHGGVLISDVVGLGKTYISAMLANTIKGKKLFIVPPVVKKTWEEILFEFGVSSYKVESLGIIEDIRKWKNIHDFSTVFIDEAHRFRNDDSLSYSTLKEICFNKKVVLITATPQNNTINDISSLITLFQSSRNSSIMPDNPNLNSYFRNLEKQLKAAKRESNYADILSDIADQIRNRVLRHVMIRRTRSEIQKFYKEDLEEQGVKFPIVKDPIKTSYTYNRQMENAFNKTIELLKQLNYARYSPLLYVRDKALMDKRKSGQENMKGFIKTMLVKRLESSIFAFVKSIERLKKWNEHFIEMFDADKIVIGAISLSNRFDIEQLKDLDDDDLEKLITERDVLVLKKEDFSGNYRDLLIKDYAIITELNNLWSKFNLTSDDAKFDRLKEIISTNNEKMIVFTESKETLDYLEDRLKETYGSSVVSYSGSDSEYKKEIIKSNFDPNHSKPSNEIRILIATDALSEGVNLHRSGIIINYDLPWNPTRIMQRIGRINRVGSDFDELIIYNFFPAVNTSKHLSLEDAIKHKIQMFHDLLGEDSRFITSEENVSTFGLYDSVMIDGDTDDIGINTKKIEFLRVINSVKRNDEKLFNKIKKLPQKLRIARKGDHDSLISFVKKGWIKTFYMTSNSDVRELEFEDAIDIIQASEHESKIDLKDYYYDYLKINYKTFKDKVNSIISENIRTTSLSKSEKQLKKIIQATKVNFKLEYEDKEYLTKVYILINEGVLDSIRVKRILKDLSLLKDLDTSDKVINVLSNNIPKNYLEKRKNYKITDSRLAEEIIILSEQFVGSED